MLRPIYKVCHLVELQLGDSMCKCHYQKPMMDMIVVVQILYHHMKIQSQQSFFSLLPHRLQEGLDVFHLLEGLGAFVDTINGSHSGSGFPAKLGSAVGGFVGTNNGAQSGSGFVGTGNGAQRGSEFNKDSLPGN